MIQATIGPHGAGVPRRSIPVKTFRFSSVTLFAAALAISGRAHADTLPVPSGYVSASSGPNLDQTAMGSGSLTAASTTSGVDMIGDPFTVSASADDFLSSKPSLQAPGLELMLTGTPVPYYSPGAVGRLQYYFTVEAPVGAPPRTVPVETYYQLGSLFSNAVFQVTGTVQASSPLRIAFDTSICGSAEFCYSFQIPVSVQTFEETIDLEPGIVESVSLAASIFFLYSSSLTANFSGGVLVDPTFTIDPAFLQQNPGYSLQFSPGIGDSPTSVPEPATWAMMLVGFGGLGAAIRVSRYFTCPVRRAMVISGVNRFRSERLSSSSAS